MWKREQWQALNDHPVFEWGVFALGIVLMILSPLAGVIPGPGGIFVFAIGLALVLRTSMWAKRRYVHFKRWQPKAGRWADWGLRRESAKRREAIRKERKAMGYPLPVNERQEDPIASTVPEAPAQTPELPGRAEPAD